MKRKLLSLLLVLALMVGYGAIAAYAVPGETDDEEEVYFILDDFNREVRYDERVLTTGTLDDGTNGTIFWMLDSGIKYNDNGDFDIIDGAVQLNYTDKGWYGVGYAMNAKDFDYLCIRVKGAKGGEQDNIYMGFADGTYDTGKVAGNRFNKLVTADGKNPVITTEWSTIVIDMNKSEIVYQGQEEDKSAYFTIDKGFLATHFNFDAEGTIDIDCMWLSNDKSGEVPETSYLKAQEKTTPAPTTEAEVTEAADADSNDGEETNADDSTEEDEKDKASVSIDEKTIFFIILGAAVVVAVFGVVVAVSGKSKKTKEDK